MTGSAPLLEGLRVVEFSQLIAAPFCGLSLLDLGAEVIKVEPPSGDTMRGLPPQLGDGDSALFAALNRGKRSVVADLGDPGGAALAARLIAGADVVLDNLGDARNQLPVTFADACAQCPRLIWCAITGWGAGQAGRTIDPSLQAAMGMISITGETDGSPVRIPVPLVDFMTGMYAVQSILVALWRAERSGRGGFLDCAMVDAAATLVSTSALLAAGGQLSPRRLGSESPLAAPSGVFVAGDGREIQLVCVTERHWRALCSVLGRPDWAEDPGFGNNAARLANRSRLHAMLAEVIASDAADAWVDRISAGGAICEHVRDIEEAWADDRLLARGVVGELDATAPLARRMPVVSLVRDRGLPGRDGGSVLPPAPALGADTEAVAAELGL